MRFYFRADDLDRAIDNLILVNACKSANSAYGGEYFAERILKLIWAKSQLADLWNYLDGVVGELERERETLKSYALARCGISNLPCERRREIKRALVKFTRHARRIENFAEGARLVNRYYCLM